MEWLKITTNSEMVRIPTQEIVFIKGDRNYSDIHLCNGKEESVACQLHDLNDKLVTLADSPFYRLGKSFIVNKNFIFKVTPGLQKLLLSSGRLDKDILLKVSKEALKTLKEELEKEGGRQ